MDGPVQTNCTVRARSNNPIVMADAPPHRDQTDESLRSERGKTDRELGRTRAEVEAESDAVLAQAQHRADEVLKVARERADHERSSTSSTLQRERAAQDRTLAEERETAASTLADEREARQKALSELLRYEREETDKDLLAERIGSDQRLGTRDEFLGIITHDLRNLLGGIALHAKLLLLEPPKDDSATTVRHRAESIQRATARMNRLLADLLDVVSIDAGHLRVTPAQNDVSAVLAESVETISLSAAAKKLVVQIVSPPEPMLAHFDYGRLLQVIANVVSNAVKFTPAGGRIELRVARERDQVHITVTDTGAGIAPQHLETIFERFHQVDRNDRRGHGLGLNISKSIIESHNGRMWAESAGLGKGSTFHITFPA